MSECQYPMTAKIISEAREKSGLKQAEFIAVNQLNVTQATFSRWETGHIQVPSSVLLKLGLVKAVIL